MSTNNQPPNPKPDTNHIGKVFARFDSNSDGKISAAELSGVLEALGSAASPDEVDRMMQEIDTDRDGHISLDEFAAFFPSNKSELMEAFNLYDQDHDGKISATELHQILSRLGERCSELDCAGMIKSVDSDGDGFVNFDEFRKMMTAAKSN
ncbi:hypothetical protein SASPL_149833 [Salvia splendens]|uniref:EF-hand domain-containing protein n=1 Tax=Salvia splendens TaxID=180675 RepID=A0A8X8Z1Y3_SALSN|nr:calcium-binding allergen Ole e 8-like [Salvia splendens]KAG6388408.1 hypothetical protein SASPL_149833 [Salvia splendens]